MSRLAFTPSNTTLFFPILQSWTGLLDVVNDTFGTVTYDGQLLDRRELWRTMVRNTIY
jgi:hypothetical protein